MPLPIVTEIIASRKAHPEARRLALEEAALELEWMARGLDAYSAKVAIDAAARIRRLIRQPAIGASDLRSPPCPMPGMTWRAKIRRVGHGERQYSLVAIEPIPGNSNAWLIELEDGTEIEAPLDELIS